YGVSKKDFGLNLLASAKGKDDGYFMMMLSPTVMPKEDMIIEKDVTFVFDTSGSMAVRKMDQAREALKYCVARLNKEDRFNVVRFSTDVESFRDKLVKANKKNRKEALEFVEDLQARGGTDINGALEAAMHMNHEKGRPYSIVFLTDGKPTIGETDTSSILENLSGCGPESSRIFVFGVGEKVNTHLLDQISGNHGGVSQYVQPEEDIEVKVSSFVDKISTPVLANLALEVKNVDLNRMHPKKIPDLFGGQQITLFGRYKGDGHVAIKLTGEVNGEKKEYVYEATFPKKQVGHDFIARLWGTRRVGYLLDEIRLHGEAAELKDEVIQLSKEYGIMTPYTSCLVVFQHKERGIRRHDAILLAQLNHFILQFRRLTMQPD
ncbi:MAG: VWA domain-containing protein, partial [Verrucomicrobiota bacterium]